MADPQTIYLNFGTSNFTVGSEEEGIDLPASARSYAEACAEAVREAYPDSEVILDISRDEVLPENSVYIESPDILVDEDGITRWIFYLFERVYEEKMMEWIVEETEEE